MDDLYTLGDLPCTEKIQFNKFMHFEMHIPTFRNVYIMNNKII